LSLGAKGSPEQYMSFKQRAMRLAIGFMRTGISVLGGRRSALVSARLVEGLAPVVSQETEHGKILFYCPGVIPEWRARTLLTKEPETIQWINSFRDNDVMWDIGANVGCTRSMLLHETWRS
jgi:hypothetical protein